MSGSFFNNRIVKTKKDHKCYDCGDRIPKGTEVIYNVGRNDGYFAYGHFCNKCTTHIPQNDAV